MLGQMEIRKKIVEPRKATSISDYSAAIREWENDIDKPKVCGGELPHAQDMIIAYLKILDNDSRAYAVDKMADAGHDGQYIGDEPEAFLQQLRKQIESRIGHWLRISRKGQIAAVLPAGRGVRPVGPR